MNGILECIGQVFGGASDEIRFGTWESKNYEWKYSSDRIKRQFLFCYKMCTFVFKMLTH